MVTYDFAHERGFKPECVVFDSGYASLDKLKQVNHNLCKKPRET